MPNTQSRDPEIDTMKELVDEAMLASIEIMRCRSPLSMTSGPELVHQINLLDHCGLEVMEKSDGLLIYILQAFKNTHPVPINDIENILSKGADINARLTQALLKDNNSFQYMQNHGTHIPLKVGWTILHIFTAFDGHQHIPALVKCGADLEAEDNDGLTPLQWALGYNIRPAAVELINAGASTNPITMSEVFLYSNYHVYRSIYIPDHPLAKAIASSLGLEIRRPSACLRHWGRCPGWLCKTWYRRVSEANMEIFAKNCLDMMGLFGKGEEYGMNELKSSRRASKYTPNAGMYIAEKEVGKKDDAVPFSQGGDREAGSNATKRMSLTNLKFWSRPNARQKGKGPHRDPIDTCNTAAPERYVYR